MTVPVTICAQRLSASMRLAPSAVPGRRIVVDVCSTPFGIYEVGTRQVRSSFPACKSAQRLSASMRLAQPPPRTLGFPVFQSIKIKHLQKSLHGSTILDGLVALYQLQTHCTKMFTRIQVSSELSKSDFARNFLRSAIGLNLPISCTPRDP